MAKVVLVTGASMGIGRATAAHLAGAGYRVFGTSRRPAEQASDGFELLGGFELLPLDVTSDESVRACVEAVIARAGRLDVLVNNAGVDLVGALEETSMAQAEWLFATNYFGVVRMVNAALPVMRRQRSGQIINVSSGLGLAAWPYEGQYVASKYAVEGYSESLRYELAPLGIRVSSVQPGFYQSNMVRTQRQGENRIDAYTPERDRFIALGQKWANDAPDPLPVAQTVRRIVESRTPRLRYPVGVDAQWGPRLAHWLPEWVLMRAGGWVTGTHDWRRDLAAVSGMAAALTVVAALTGHRIRKKP